jgi:adenylate cyclase
MTDLVFAHEGTVAKIVGDALHILFGAPGEQTDHASRAVACALGLDDYAQMFRERWREKGITLGITRIGVHAGPALVGNFGGGRFFDYTAYGDTINIAARLEVANKQLGTRICVSAILAAKDKDFRGRPIGDLILRGRSEALRAFEPLRREQYSALSTKSYLEAFNKLEVGDSDAIAAFAAHVGRNPEDQLASFHLKRLLNGGIGTRIAMD